MLASFVAARTSTLCRPLSLRRNVASDGEKRYAPIPSMMVFNRTHKRQQRNRIALHESTADFGYLRKEVGERLVDRLDDILQKRFATALDLGAHAGELAPLLAHRRPDIRHLIQLDSSADMLRRDATADDTVLDLRHHEAPQRELASVLAASEARRAAMPTPTTISSSTPAQQQQQQQATASSSSSSPPLPSSENSPMHRTLVVADEEFLPLPENSLDLVISNLSLHWINDLPGVFAQARRALKPDGVFIASILGESTLFELRDSITLASMERHGGVEPRVSPFAGVGDVGNLLIRAGFALPTVDQELITVNYQDPFVLMHDLQWMGESHAPFKPASKKLTRDTLMAIAATYRAVFGNADGSVPASYQIVYLIGWAPAPTQPKPLARGSAQFSLKDLAKGATPQPLPEEEGLVDAGDEPAPSSAPSASSSSSALAPDESSEKKS